MRVDFVGRYIAHMTAIAKKNPKSIICMLREERKQNHIKCSFQTGQRRQKKREGRKRRQKNVRFQKKKKGNNRIKKEIIMFSA